MSICEGVSSLEPKITVSWIEWINKAIIIKKKVINNINSAPR